MVTSVINPDQPGPQGVIVTEVDQNGEKKTFKTFTNEAGILAMAVPFAAEMIQLARVDRNGNTTPITQTDVISAPTTQVTTHGPTITGTSSTIEMTGKNAGNVVFQTKGTNPLTTIPYMDNQPMVLRAASDTSIVAGVPPGTVTGTHNFSVTSDGVKSNKVQSDVITVTPGPLPVMHSGSSANATVHVQGIPEEHNPMVHFEVSGAAKLASGASSADVPVKNGVATVKILGKQLGSVTVGYEVRSTIPATN